MYNHPTKSRSQHREASINSVVIEIAKKIIISDKTHLEIFWKKITERKGAAIPDLKRLEVKLEELSNIPLSFQSK